MRGIIVLISCILLGTLSGYAPGRLDAAALADPPLGTPLQVLLPEFRLGSFTHMAEILPSRRVPRGGPVVALPRDEHSIGDVTYRIFGKKHNVEEYLTNAKVMAYLVLKDGKVAYESYRLGTDDNTAFVSWSVAKSFTSTLVGIAQADGAIRSIDDRAASYAPALASSGYAENSIRDLIDMSSGVKFLENYAALDTLEAKAWIEGTVTHSVASYTDTFAWFKERIHPPGTTFYYASIEPAIAAWVVQRATGKHLSDLLSERIWRKLGAEHDASWLLDRPGGIEIGSCCINATLRDYGRFGLMIMNEGRVGKAQLLPAAWIREATRTSATRAYLDPAAIHRAGRFGYHHNWWIWPEADHAASALGAHGQQIMVDFDDRVVIVQTSVWDDADNPRDVAEAAAVQEAIVASLRDRGPDGKPAPRGRKLQARAPAVRRVAPTVRLIIDQNVRSTK